MEYEDLFRFIIKTFPLSTTVRDLYTLGIGRRICINYFFTKCFWPTFEHRYVFSFCGKISHRSIIFNSLPSLTYNDENYFTTGHLMLRTVLWDGAILVGFCCISRFFMSCILPYPPPQTKVGSTLNWILYVSWIKHVYIGLSTVQGLLNLLHLLPALHVTSSTKTELVFVVVCTNRLHASRIRNTTAPNQREHTMIAMCMENKCTEINV